MTSGHYYESYGSSDDKSTVVFVRHHRFVHQEPEVVTEVDKDLAGPLCDLMNHFIKSMEER